MSNTRDNALGYVHQPLDNPREEIRVLHILPASHGTIQCKITHNHLKELRDLEAEHVCLSYMWGNDIPSNLTEVNGKSLMVRTNLFNFLKTARRLQISDPLWIDALCIDQSNREERDDQVQRMAEIYHSAKHVLVYPGELSAVSIKAAGFIARIATLVGPLKSNSWRTLMHAQWYRPSLRKLLSMPLIWKAGNLPYWKFLWVVQELAMAKQLFVVLHDRLLPWTTFQNAYHAWGLYNHTLPVLWDLPSEKLSLSTLVLKFASLECKDPKDHVFGLLGLTTSLLKVDYNRSPSSLFLEVFEEAQCRLRFLPRRKRVKALRSIAHKVATALDMTSISVCGDCPTDSAWRTENESEDDRSFINCYRPWSKPEYIDDETTPKGNCVAGHQSMCFYQQEWEIQSVVGDEKSQRAFLIWRRGRCTVDMDTGTLSGNTFNTTGETFRPYIEGSG